VSYNQAFMTKYLLLFSLVFIAGQAFGQETIDHVSFGGNLTIHDSAALQVAPATKLVLSDSSKLAVKNGFIRLAGNESDSALITSGGHYNFVVETGGTLTATYAIIEKLAQGGLMIEDTAVVNLQNVHFRYGTASGTFITANHTNDKTFDQVRFSGTSNANNNGFLEAYNVTTNNEQGSLTFTNFTGNFAGSRFENDNNHLAYWYDDTLNVTIPGGWSGLSSYVLPQTNLETLFYPIVNPDSVLTILQSQTGMYLPGQNTNTIGIWNTHDGYKIKLTDTIDFSIDFSIPGEYERQKKLSLSAGWNLIPVLSECDVNVETLFDATDIEIVKEVAGIGIYWPSQSINTLVTLQPGKAYYVRMQDVDEIEFPACGNLTGFNPVRAGLSGLGGSRALIRLSPWKLSPPTPSSHTIAMYPEATEVFEAPNIIGVFDGNGSCFGLTMVENRSTPLAAFGNDWFTGEKDGFIEGDQMFFRLFNLDDGSQLDLQPVFDDKLPQHDGTFTTHGLSAIKQFKTAKRATIRNANWQVRVFPNPADGRISIAGVKPGAVVVVADVQGQHLLTQNVQTEDLFKLDLSSFQPGVYLIKIQLDGQQTIKKLVLQ
jgi:hypothetical protein